MDLQSLLSHRSHCIICGNEMKCHAPEYPKLLFYIDEAGMKVASGHNKHGIRMHFRFDGKYTRTKQNYRIYREPITIIKRCDTCHKGNPAPITPALTQAAKVILKGRSVGATTAFAAAQQAYFTSLNNMKSKECFYRFQIMGDAQGNYDGSLNHEVVRYHDDESFYHIDTSFLTGSSIMNHGKFHGSLNDVLTLKIPSVVNLGSVKTLDQFMSKYKMYMLMS